MSSTAQSSVRSIPATRGAAAALVIVLGGALLVGIGVLTGWAARGPTYLPPRDIPDPLKTPASAYRWREQPDPLFPIPPYARFLKGVTIVLDPGHVGQSEKDKPKGWKRGPTGLREAEANLRVALSLRDFLASAGARVELTRSVDRSLDLPDAVDLRERAEVANRLNADLLLSLHHNAASNPQANFTSIYYHKSPDHDPAALAAARYVLMGLNDALRLDNHLECALLSDEQMYPGDGFGVLRHARVPAVLCESSFHSNVDEEERLRDPVYNRREAYGIFLGLARWAQAGLPRVSLIEPADGRVVPGQSVLVRVDDGLSSRGGWGKERVKIVGDSLVVRVNGRRVDCTPDLDNDRLRFVVPDALPAGPAELSVSFENLFGNRVVHPDLALSVGAPASAPSSAPAAPPPPKPAAKKKPTKRR